MTYREAILLGESILQKAKIVDAKNDAWLLLAMACRINHTYYYCLLYTSDAADE